MPASVVPLHRSSTRRKSQHPCAAPPSGNRKYSARVHISRTLAQRRRIFSCGRERQPLLASGATILCINHAFTFPAVAHCLPLPPKMNARASASRPLYPGRRAAGKSNGTALSRAPWAPASTGCAVCLCWMYICAAFWPQCAARSVPRAASVLDPPRAGAVRSLGRQRAGAAQPCAGGGLVSSKSPPRVDVYYIRALFGKYRDSEHLACQPGSL
ncbi:hypothetical protein B0H15DRAFT_654881 [Mycena belliarum]|uniref:Uncharacterized protein n=1 Tax=Mycena belliarum TaxID=1033014 RepID=A0AAD6TRC3_9AGAR|nr:hypothetical protein B0H15DRAFT_654881 [Mycena belliae]